MKNISIYIQVGMTILFQVSASQSIAQKKKAFSSGMARITVTMSDAKIGDTVRLASFNQIYTSAGKELSQVHKEYIATRKEGGRFVFNFNVTGKMGYFSLYKVQNADNQTTDPGVSLLKLYLVEPNDSIHINIRRDSTYHTADHLINDSIPEIEFFPDLKYQKQYRVEFSGIHAQKYRLRYLLDQLISASTIPFKTDSNGVLTENPAITAGLNVFRKKAGKIRPLLANIIKLDFISEIELSQLRMLSGYKRYDLITQYLTRHHENYNDEIKLNSRFYAALILASYDEIYPNKIAGKSLTTGAYFYIKDDCKPGEWRDKLLCMYLNRWSSRLQNSVLDDAEQTIKTPFYRIWVSDIAASITIGKPAYNFELTNTEGKKVRLSDFRGKAVFIDFWFTGCGACRKYFNEVVSKAEEHFKSDDRIAFLTISIDTKFDNWVKSVNTGEYTSAKAINLYTNGQGMYHPVIDRYQVTSGFPRPILIDKNGRIFSDKGADLRNNGTSRLVAKIEDAIRH